MKTLLCFLAIALVAGVSQSFAQSPYLLQRGEIASVRLLDRRVERGLPAVSRPAPTPSSRSSDGCVLQETWAGASGSAGSSFSYYDPQKDQWEQFWVWRNGTTLYNKGHFEDGKMVLKGESVNPQTGDPVQNRITWSANDDGSVRQHWEVSSDGGETWSTAFDGHYTKMDS